MPADFDEKVADLAPGRQALCRDKGLWRRLAANLLPSLCQSISFASTALVAIALIICLPIAAALVALKFVDPPVTMVIAGDRLAGKNITQYWVPLRSISPALVRAVVASEDARFCYHNGIDSIALEDAIARARESGLDAARGASTITMQVAKNLFLWNGRSLARKGLEIPLALAIDAIWTKRRILEVYLNIAEWGPGVYGAEAGARRHFRTSASRLNRRQSALMAVSLPNPKLRSPGRASWRLRRMARRIELRSLQMPRSLGCIYRSQKRR